MRTSLSCDACRKSKLRCSNNGSPPCRRCQKSCIPGCQLSRPCTRGKPGYRKRAPVQRRSSASGAGSGDGVGPAGKDCASRDEAESMGTSIEVAIDAEPQPQPSDPASHLENLPVGVILKALNVFTQNFPELHMLHPVLFQSLFDTGHEMKLDCKALLAALLAAVKKQEPYSDASWMGTLLSHQVYAEYACDALARCMFQRPDVTVVQAHLILTMYEWGVREFQKAWIHCGIAVRIIQSLHSVRVAPIPLHELPNDDCELLCQIVETATYWACFILDCIINSGTYNPRVLSIPESRKIGIPRPASGAGFNFGFRQQPMAEGLLSLDLDQEYEILVRGFDIYAEVMAFNALDGRRAPGMCSAEQCPWVAGSAWANCRRRLEEWRTSLDPRFLYPNHNVGIHSGSGLGRSFVYINLLYYHCIMMLQREYFPFLPKPNAVPQGPTEPPLLEATAPVGWWDDSARELFQAAGHIADMMKQASDWGLAMMTPVPAFCCFTACYLNQYAYRFPSMTAGHSPRAKQQLDDGLAYLNEFRKSWDLGEGWIKTIQSAKILFEQAVSKADAYHTKSRLDFEVLDRSAREFRTLDRSAQQMETIRSAENRTTAPENMGGPFQVSAIDMAGELISCSADQVYWPTWDSMVLEGDLGYQSSF